MSQTVTDALRASEFQSDERAYRLAKLPANGITLAAGIVAEASLPFSALLADKDEVTLMLPEEACREFKRRLRGASIADMPYRLITLSAILEPDLVGFIARISQALADADIPVLAYAAYSRDHLFVPAADFDKALGVLETLRDRV